MNDRHGIDFQYFHTLYHFSPSSLLRIVYEKGNTISIWILYFILCTFARLFCHYFDKVILISRSFQGSIVCTTPGVYINLWIGVSYSISARLFIYQKAIYRLAFLHALYVKNLCVRVTWSEILTCSDQRIVGLFRAHLQCFVYWYNFECIICHLNVNVFFKSNTVQKRLNFEANCFTVQSPRTTVHCPMSIQKYLCLCVEEIDWERFP